MLHFPYLSSVLCRLTSVLLFDTPLPEKKRRGVVIQANIFIGAVGRLKIFSGLGPATTCKEARYANMDKSIQKSQKQQHNIEQPHTQGHLHKGRLG